MTRPRGLLALVLLALAAGAGCAASPASALVVGIADQKPQMFDDARFSRLGIQHARYAVGWDVMSEGGQRAELDDWLRAARRASVQPLISFGHSRTDGRRRSLPTPERFKYEFRRLRAAYPWVTTFATWNEANHCGEPTCHRPELVAAYYRAMRIECPRCTILAAEVLDMPNMVSWIKAFRRASRVEPRYWGLHNYLDANRLSTTRTRRLLAATKGQVWMTETGGIVARRNRSATAGFPESTRHAKQVTQWVFDDIVPLSRRFTRVYLYHWNQGSRIDSWDSALINLHGKVRPAFGVLRRVVDDLSARRRTAASRP